MIRSVVSIPSQASKRAIDGSTKEASTSRKESSRDRIDVKANDHHKGVSLGSGDASTSAVNQKPSLKKNAKKKSSPEEVKSETCLLSGSKKAVVEVTSIDGFSKLVWPSHILSKTTVKPVITYSCNPSFYDHDVCLSKEEEQRRSNLFVISDILDDIIDYIEYSEQAKDGQKSNTHHHHHHHKSKKSKKKKKSRKHKKERAASETVEKHSTAKSTTAAQSNTEKSERPHDRRRHKKSKKHHKHRNHDKGESLPQDSTTKLASDNQSALKKQPDQQGSQLPVAETQQSSKSPTVGQLTKPNTVKSQKKVKKSVKKKATPSESTGNEITEQDAVPAKKPKTAKKEEPKPIESTTSTQKIKIEFTQNSSKPTIATSTKSKWDTSSDEEGSSRKGAISYRFSDDSDVEEGVTNVESHQQETTIDRPKPTPFSKMQSGGMLQTIEMNNPLPESKPSVPIAHPNPGPDAPETTDVRSRSYSRSYSRSTSRSYSSDDSYYRSKRSRGRRRRRRSYTRSYTRSRSRSYSSYSRSRSRSYSRSYSRSTSRSYSRYRSSSRSSYSSYSSYSSRSRSRSPRYTRAVQPKYNTTRAYNMGKRKKFKKNKQFKSQQPPQQNPNIKKQLETGRAKAEETVMRLKKQKEEQQELQNRAMASIAAAASSAGITLPTTTPSTNTTASIAPATSKTTAASPNNTKTTVTESSGSAQNGVDLLETYREASQLVNTPAFVPRNFQQREFIGPVRPGVDPEGDIPMPTEATNGAVDAGNDLLHQFIQEDPKPMEPPDTQDAHYKDLQEQAVQHIISTANPSPGTDHLQQLAAAQYVPVAESQIIIDPLTGQPVQVSAVHTPQTIHQHSYAVAAGAHTPTVAEAYHQEEEKPAPHEAVIRSYADQVIMSNHKALVSQAQPVFSISSMASSIPQAGVPIQASPMMVNAAQQIQLAQQAQMLQQAQQVQAAQIQAAQLHNLQMQSMGLGAAVPLVNHAGLQQLIAQQQLMQPHAAAAPAQVVQLPTGQLVFAQHHPQLLLQRFARPM